jgi:hypothetical protein
MALNYCSFKNTLRVAELFRLLLADKLLFGAALPPLDAIIVARFDLSRAFAAKGNAINSYDDEF